MITGTSLIPDQHGFIPGRNRCFLGYISLVIYLSVLVSPRDRGIEDVRRRCVIQELRVVKFFINILIIFSY
jgi:hypothetical protein